MLESLVSILGLVSIFKSERKSTSDDENQDFIKWLLHTNHKNIVEEINTNHKLGLSIKVLLQQNHSDLLETLKEVDNSIALLTSRINGISDISHAIYPSIELSEQAISIIKQVIESDGNKFTEFGKGEFGGISYMLEGSNKINLTEPQFIEDDLIQLTKLKLLIGSINSAGNREFQLTRFSIKYISQINKL